MSSRDRLGGDVLGGWGSAAGNIVSSRFRMPFMIRTATNIAGCLFCTAGVGLSLGWRGFEVVDPLLVMGAGAWFARSTSGTRGDFGRGIR